MQSTLEGPVPGLIQTKVVYSRSRGCTYQVYVPKNSFRLNEFSLHRVFADGLFVLRWPSCRESDQIVPQSDPESISEALAYRACNIGSEGSSSQIRAACPRDEMPNVVRQPNIGMKNLFQQCASHFLTGGRTVCTALFALQRTRRRCLRPHTADTQQTARTWIGWRNPR